MQPPVPRLTARENAGREGEGERGFFTEGVLEFLAFGKVLLAILFVARHLNGRMREKVRSFVCTRRYFLRSGVC